MHLKLIINTPDRQLSNFHCVQYKCDPSDLNISVTSKKW